MLFSFHAAMVFDGFGESWYIYSKDLFILILLDFMKVLTLTPRHSVI
jgi:hypothetical protein